MRLFFSFWYPVFYAFFWFIAEVFKAIWEFEEFIWFYRLEICEFFVFIESLVESLLPDVVFKVYSVSANFCYSLWMFVFKFSLYTSNLFNFCVSFYRVFWESAILISFSFIDWLSFSTSSLFSLISFSREAILFC